MNMNVAGIAVEVFGLIILFRYGMPFRLPTGGETFIITSDINESERSTDRFFEVFSYFGFAFTIAGAVMQMYGSWT